MGTNTPNNEKPPTAAAAKSYAPLFDTNRRSTKSQLLNKLFAATVLLGICSIWFYRFTHPAPTTHRWVWVGALFAEIWFGLYWVLTQAGRWDPVFRSTHKDRLADAHPDKTLPGVDVFVCTADHTIEPPILVVNTVLSLVAYDYPPDKLAVYLSDDGASEFTLYAMLEAARFARCWVPFCGRFDVKPRSPEAYFAAAAAGEKSKGGGGGGWEEELVAVKKQYEEMKDRIESATQLGRIPEDALLQHKEAFSHWDGNNKYSWRRDHPTILHILIDGRDPPPADGVNGSSSLHLPTLVYLAREKRPQHHHNFKAGAMNALIRVSSKISNAPILLNLDCDMYSNDPSTLRDALCFFMDDRKNHDVAFLQLPQMFDNVTKNDIYGSSLLVISRVEFPGLDSFGGPMYIGSGCFHRRDVLCGRDFDPSGSKLDWTNYGRDHEHTVEQLEREAKPLADIASDHNTLWGTEMGLKYGCPVEDVITGLSIQCKGWKSMYFDPKREAFLGKAPTTWPQTLVQHKRWSEGDFQILLSRFSPAWYASGRISIGLQMMYLCYCLWAPNCLAVLYYSIIPSLCLLKGIPLFPQISSPWVLPFAYAVAAKYLYSLAEFLYSGGTILGWWNEQRTWLYKRTCSYLFAFVDTILKTMGLGESGFVITAKVADEDVARRYDKEIMEFGVSSPMFNILATIAMLNLFSLFGVVVRCLVAKDGVGVRVVFDEMGLQLLLCGALVLINWPLYQAVFFRKDKGRMPGSVSATALVSALVVCTSFVFLY
ncbi:unnamed protein product [Linum trigynum]|uniref:Cellulose synthase-like protein E1 n=1 Tax=Linum trigynum TaxID=586398 RepID=A0AAV2EFM5_9ROSI